ncbi:MAG: hypothetical protein J7M40_05495 [Planctomycetes bacterium]|nr:hypothetical protein [Planctomycetota bacterium]
MNKLSIELISRINAIFTAVFGWMVGPVMRLPGWLSCAVLAGIAALLILIIYKYTSNQKAIRRIRNRIKANLLAMRLYKDSLQVTLAVQWELFKAGVALLLNSLVPLAVMLMPMMMILAQLQSWYGYEPLAPGAEAVVTVQLDSSESLSSVKISSISGAHIVTGPVRIQSLAQAAWVIQADEAGDGKITLKVNEEEFEKSLAIGKAQYMQISSLRPGPKITDVLLYPAERPFKTDSAVKSVAVGYPQRTWRTGITNSWLVDFFIMSCALALLLKNVIKVSF